jgi:PAS domain S-box-containing protein
MANFVDSTDAAEDMQLALDSPAPSRRQMAAIIQTAMDAIIATDEDQRIMIFNAAAERMFGCPAAEALGGPLTRFIPKRFREEHAEQVRFFGATGGTCRKMRKMGTVWGARADGKEIPLEVSISRVESDGRKLFTAILRDISERVRFRE